MYTQKIANMFDHIQEPCVDHSRSGLENKFLENKSGRIFLRSTGLLYKFLPTNLRWNSTFYHTDLDRTEYGILQFFNVQDDQSWAFSETVQKISKIGHNHLYGLALCCCLLDLDYNTIVWNTKFYHPTNFGIKRIKTQCKSSSFASIKWPKRRDSWSGCGRLGVSVVLSRTAVDSDWCFNNLVVVIITN